MPRLSALPAISSRIFFNLSQISSTCLPVSSRDLSL